MRWGGWVVGLVTVLYVVGLKIAIFLGWGNDGQKFIDKTLAAHGLEEPRNSQKLLIESVGPVFCFVFFM